MPDSKDFKKWIIYAEQHWNSASILLDNGSLDAAYYFQQAIEKYFKAILLKNSLKLPRIHDVEKLLLMVDPNISDNPTDLSRIEAAELIDDIMPAVRYPDDIVKPTLEDIRKIKEAAKILRDFARSRLDLDDLK